MPRRKRRRRISIEDELMMNPFPVPQAIKEKIIELAKNPRKIPADIKRKYKSRMQQILAYIDKLYGTAYHKKYLKAVKLQHGGETIEYTTKTGKRARRKLPEYRISPAGEHVISTSTARKILKEAGVKMSSRRFTKAQREKQAILKRPEIKAALSKVMRNFRSAWKHATSPEELSTLRNYLSKFMRKVMKEGKIDKRNPLYTGNLGFAVADDDYDIADDPYTSIIPAYVEDYGIAVADNPFAFRRFIDNVIEMAVGGSGLALGNAVMNKAIPFIADKIPEDKPKLKNAVEYGVPLTLFLGSAYFKDKVRNEKLYEMVEAMGYAGFLAFLKKVGGDKVAGLIGDSDVHVEDNVPAITDGYIEITPERKADVLIEDGADAIVEDGAVVDAENKGINPPVIEDGIVIDLDNEYAL